MFKRELEARQSLPTLQSRLTMREQEHVLHPNGHSLLRRHSSLAASTSARTPRNDRSQSTSSNLLQMTVSRTPDLTKRRPSLVPSRPKERKDSTSSSSTEHYSFVVLGVGGVGKTGNVLFLIIIYLR